MSTYCQLIVGGVIYLQSYDTVGDSDKYGNKLNSNGKESVDLTSMTKEEVGQKLLATQKFLNTIRNERDRLQYQLADMQVADEKLRRRISENFGQNIPKENKDLAKYIQYMIAEEQMSHLENLKQEKEKMELELKQAQYQMADEKYEKLRLAKQKELV